jgi:hypothetical protein
MTECDFDLDVMEDEIPRLFEQLEWLVGMLLKTKENSPRRMYYIDRVKLFVSEIGKLQKMKKFLLS